MRSMLRAMPVVLVSVVAFACAQTVRVPPDAGSATTAFVGATMLPMSATDTVLHDHTVVVSDGRIVMVAPTAAVRLPRDARKIDARGRFLLPGLIDSHVHLEYLRDPAILELFLVNGVTTVRNMDGRPYLLEWRDGIASGQLRGPTIVTAGPILDGDPPVRDDNTVVRDAAGARAAVAAQDSAGYDLVKVYANLSADAYRAVLLEAHARRKPVAGHVPRRMSVADAIAAGQHSIEHLADFDDLIEADSSSVRGRFHWSRLYLAIPADRQRMADAAQLVARAGTWIVPTLVQADRAVAGADTVRAWLESPDMGPVPADVRTLWRDQLARVAARLDSADWQLVGRGVGNRRALVAALHAAGAPIAVGTDTPNAFVVPGSSVHQELVAFARAGLTPRAALIAATRDAARLLRDPDTGTIETGKRADLLLLSANPLAAVENARSIEGVMVRGRWLPPDTLAAMRHRLKSLQWLAQE